MTLTEILAALRDWLSEDGESRQAEYPQDTLRGTVEIHGDIIEPVLPVGEWEAEGKEE